MLPGDVNRILTTLQSHATTKCQTVPKHGYWQAPQLHCLSADKRCQRQVVMNVEDHSASAGASNVNQIPRSQSGKTQHMTEIKFWLSDWRRWVSNKLDYNDQMTSFSHVVDLRWGKRCRWCPCAVAAGKDQAKYMTRKVSGWTAIARAIAAKLRSSLLPEYWLPSPLYTWTHTQHHFGFTSSIFNKCRRPVTNCL